MKFTLTIDSDSADLEAGGRERLAEILHEEIDAVAGYGFGDHRIIRDGNGNTIGWWTLVEDSKGDAE